MTKEEREKAIDLLDNLLGMVEDNQDNDYDKALKMGIESLRKEPISDWHDVQSNEMTLEQSRQAVRDLREKLAECLRKEPSEDAVSRQAVLDMATTIQTDDYSGNEIMEVVDIDEIKALPSVTPTQKWIPVKEKLPEESLNSVIGWDSYRERCVFVQFIDGHFQITGKNESFDIQAWMPLPPSYKGE